MISALTINNNKYLSRKEKKIPLANPQPLYFLLMDSSNKMILRYWAIRGLAQPLRFLLEYLELPYEDKRYGSDRDEWFNKDKPQLKSDFPNLPNLQDGETVICETEAIAAYIAYKAKRLDMLGKEDMDKIRLLEAYGVIRDVTVGLTKTAYSPDYEKLSKVF